MISTGHVSFFNSYFLKVFFLVEKCAVVFIPLSCCLVHETSRNLKLNNQQDSLCCKVRVFICLVEDIQSVGSGPAGSLSNDWTPGPERSHGLSPFFFLFLFSKKGTLSLYLLIGHSAHVEVRAQLVLCGCFFYMWFLEIYLRSSGSAAASLPLALKRIF